ncbi:3-deoxy-D-manno-octulosonic acid kinase [Vibrio viridaestus]|uniref:3-deoxy-D-manno-octulosonic acid kinase n=1 Tax=Vibrio viridaestus TaxID=2487322 RepID=A0A3N9TC51_9VIBR|nr:3-deoxy-D-manno-octulosonic acid kinase [Vibrio viridaestus]RQW61731.1 3-deoxy-D-manno-octulosonic acid kinase [Vibrio viridaestus]
MKTVENKNQKIWYNEDLLSADPRHCFSPDYWQLEDRIIGSAKGRGTTWFIQLHSLAGALRHYRRGGLFGKLVSDHYWFSGWKNTRSFQEFTILENLHAQGVHVPRPIAARAVKRTFCYQADLITEKVPHARDLVSILKEKPLSGLMYQKIGQEIRKMHDAGVNHTDLNIHNILVDEQDKIWIIDFDKCSIEKNERFKQGNLSRLKRSFEKEKMKWDIHWSMKDFDDLISAYY